MRAKVRRERGEGGENVGGGGGRWLSNCVQIPPTPIHMHKPSLVLLPVTPATKTALRGVEKRKVFVHISLLICDLMPFNLYFLLVTANICFSYSTTNNYLFFKVCFLKNEVNDMYRGIFDYMTEIIFQKWAVMLPKHHFKHVLEIIKYHISMYVPT